MNWCHREMKIVQYNNGLFKIKSCMFQITNQTYAFNRIKDLFIYHAWNGFFKANIGFRIIRSISLLLQMWWKTAGPIVVLSYCLPMVPRTWFYCIFVYKVKPLGSIGSHSKWYMTYTSGKTGQKSRLTNLW